MLGGWWLSGPQSGPSGGSTQFSSHVSDGTITTVGLLLEVAAIVKEVKHLRIACGRVVGAREVLSLVLQAVSVLPAVIWIRIPAVGPGGAVYVMSTGCRCGSGGSSSVGCTAVHVALITHGTCPT